MPEPHLTDPQKLSDYGSFLGGLAAVVGGIVATVKSFPTKRFVNDTYVKKVEPDGTRSYVHITDWAKMETMHKEALSENAKWQAIAKDWIERG